MRGVWDSCAELRESVWMRVTRQSRSVALQLTHTTSRLPFMSSGFLSKNEPGEKFTPAWQMPTLTFAPGHFFSALSSAPLKLCTEAAASYLYARTRSSGTLSSSLASEPGRERESRRS